MTLAKLKKFHALAISEKKILIHYVACFVFYKCLVRFFPYKWYKNKLGKLEKIAHKNKPGGQNDLTPYLMAHKRLKSTAKSWRSRCLVDALTLAHFCRLKKVPYKLILGGRKETDMWCFHAWLHIGNTVVIGERKGDPFTPIATFYG